jgi:hypothetical protein
MSTTLGQSNAAKCTDGNVGTFCHSEEEESPWLQLDLGQDTLVKELQIYNRADAGPTTWPRLGLHQIWIGGTSGTEFKSSSVKCYEGTAASELGPFIQPCKGKGRYVTIVLPGAPRILNLGEIEVFKGVPAPEKKEPDDKSDNSPSLAPSFVPTPSPTAVGSVCVMYFVKSGDTIQKIAAKFTEKSCPVTAQEIILFNSVVNETAPIGVGNNYIIPCPGNCCTDNSCSQADYDAVLSNGVQEEADLFSPSERGSGAQGYQVAVGLLSIVVVGLGLAVMALLRNKAAGVDGSTVEGDPLTHKKKPSRFSNTEWLAKKSSEAQVV